MKIIGLTGGIGTGKSTVSDYLRKKGFSILDADQIARDIVRPGSDILPELAAVFGQEIILEDGSLDRKKLGSIIFADQEKKAALDGIMHKRILDEIEELLAMHCTGSNEPVFIDAPLLFETGLDRLASETWVVDVDDEIRIERIMDRDGLSRKEILNRIEMQMSRSEKLEKADEVIDNSGKKEILYVKIEKLLQKL